MMYNPVKTERKWQKIWEKSGINKIKDRVRGKKNFYHLVMFPYPSGSLHIGHWYNFVPADVFARLKRMQGLNVLSPIGFDAFGLPAENAAIERKIHPRAWTMKNIAAMRKQLKSMGNTYDFSREVITSNPDYYKWTQWMFLQMFKAGLAYRKKAFANWCPKDQAVLANEQVIDGRCWRHPDTLVVQKEVEQWFLKTTNYAEKLLSGLEKIDWPERTKTMQKNWIGKSEGAIVKFKIQNDPFNSIQGHTERSRMYENSKIDNYIEVFTTRIDTLFSAAFLILAPEHPLVEQIATQQQKDAVRHYVTNTHLKTELERTSLEKEKTGVWTGAYAINPANEEKIPVWISDFVLASYGTGAVFADAHDKRDFEMAKKFNIPLRVSIRPTDDTLWEKVKNLEECYAQDGILVNSSQFNGLTSAASRLKITHWLSDKGLARFQVNYKLRDWLISRQRYWGALIPLVFCEHCAIKIKNQPSTSRAQVEVKSKIKINERIDFIFINGKQYLIVPVPEKDLPVKLPMLKNFRPVAGGKSPLARVKSFVDTKCPKCRKKAIRETDTMDTFVDSSWYFLRYPDSKNKKQFASKDKLKNWLPVNMYIGGAEHTVLHLLYSRFFTKFLQDDGHLEPDEPFLALRHQGIILGQDGQKMSKSRGNVVDPDDLVRKYGADTVRMHLCFMSEYDQGGPWNPGGILGVKRFLDKIWNFFNSKFKIQNPKLLSRSPKGRQAKSQNLDRLLHRTIKKVGEDIENFRFNTAVSALMILFNAIEKEKIMTRDIIETFLKLLAPFAPHLTEEIWSRFFVNKKSIHFESWPEYNARLTKAGEYELVIQIDGKLRDRVKITKELKQSEVEKLVLSREIVRKHLGGKTPKKIIFIPNRLINIVY